MTFLSTSRRPVLIAGNGVRSAGAADLLYELIDRTGMPVVTTMNAVDLMEGDLRIGFFGTYGNRVANDLLNRCDLVISVGARLGLRQIGRDPRRFAPQASLVRVDVDQSELARTVKPDEEKVLMDAAAFLKTLLSEEGADFWGWRRRCIAARDLLEGVDDTEGNRVVKAIAAQLPRDPVVCVDVGQNQCWTAQSLSLRGRGGRVLIAGGYGSMGCGLPFAIGAAAASPGMPVYCLTGDGGLQMNIQELEVLAREGLPVKVLVLDNRELGKISEVQAGSYGGRFAQTTEGSGYTVPDFVAVAKAYGIRAKGISDCGELGGCARWLSDDAPCLIDIPVPQGTKLIPKVNFATMEVEPAIDPRLKAELEKVYEGLGAR